SSAAVTRHFHYQSCIEHKDFKEAAREALTERKEVSVGQKKSYAGAVEENTTKTVLCDINHCLV
ncbi:Hypothetical predicted protein, partial [Podarcis lilfordi]